MLCCVYTLTDFPISIRLTSLALWQSNDCPSASKATLMNMDKYVMWIHYEQLHNHNKAKHNKTVCIFLGIYCMRSVVPETCAWVINYIPQSPWDVITCPSLALPFLPASGTKALFQCGMQFSLFDTTSKFHCTEGKFRRLPAARRNIKISFCCWSPVYQNWENLAKSNQVMKTTRQCTCRIRREVVFVFDDETITG